MIGKLVREMIEESKCQNIMTVDKIQKRCNKINNTIYGGKSINYWLTGLKYALIKMGVFKTTNGYLQYPLPASARLRIDKMLKKEKKILLP